MVTDDGEPGGIQTHVEIMMRLKQQKFDNGRIVKSGTITVDDIRKKFNLPIYAEITVHIPDGGRLTQYGLGENISHLSVKIETIE